jgi:hypothetical protein
VSTYSQASICRNAVRSARCAGEFKSPEAPQLCIAITDAPGETLEQSVVAAVDISNSFNGFAEVKASPTIPNPRGHHFQQLPLLSRRQSKAQLQP